MSARHRAMVIVAAAGLLAFSPTFAADTSGEPPASYSAPAWHLYATALADVQRIQMRYGPRLEAALPEAREPLRAEMEAAMIEAVRAHGFDRPTFNLFSERVEQDRHLARQVRNQVGRELYGR